MIAWPGCKCRSARCPRHKKRRSEKSYRHSRIWQHKGIKRIMHDSFRHFFTRDVTNCILTCRHYCINALSDIEYETRSSKSPTSVLEEKEGFLPPLVCVFLHISIKSSNITTLECRTGWQLIYRRSKASY